MRPGFNSNPQDPQTGESSRFGFLRTLATVLLAGLVIAGCVALTTTAAALALGRPRIERLNTETESKLAADYSADPRNIVIPPLSFDLIA